MQEFTIGVIQVNGFVNTLGQAASQFYGAGALRELIKLRQGQQFLLLLLGFWPIMRVRVFVRAQILCFI